MSGASSWEQCAHRAAVRDAVAAFVRAHGFKMGIHLAAKAIGISERVARHAHEGGSFAADGERAKKACDAHLALVNQQILQLNAEAARVGTRGLNVRSSLARGLALAGAALGRKGRAVREAGKAVLRRGEPVSAS